MRKAVIDMGTNSTRLAIGEMMDGKMQIVYTQVAETRLGEGMGNERVIQPVPLERNVETVKRFAQTAQLLNAYDLRVTATSAVRDAVNQDEVKQVISKAAGVQMEILPGAVEAQLSYLGASGDFQHLNRPLAVLDIGGGSTELVYPVEDGVHGASVNVGAVRLLEHPELRNETAQMLASLKEASLPASMRIGLSPVTVMPSDSCSITSTMIAGLAFSTSGSIERSSGIHPVKIIAAKTAIINNSQIFFIKNLRSAFSLRFSKKAAAGGDSLRKDQSFSRIIYPPYLLQK